MIEYHVHSLRGRTVATFSAEALARAFILTQSTKRVSLRLFRVETQETEL